MKGVFFRGDNVLNKPIIIEIDKPIDIPIHSVQFDKNSRFIDVYLLNNSIPLDVTKCTVTVAGVKSDGQEFFNECDKINPEEGLVRFEITEQMNVSPGIVNCEIKVYSDSAGVLTTKPFSIKVTRSLLKSDIESTGEFRALTEAISKVQGFDNKLVDLRNDTNEKFAQTNAQLSELEVRQVKTPKLELDIAIDGSNIFFSNLKKNRDSTSFGAPFFFINGESNIVSNCEITSGSNGIIFGNESYETTPKLMKALFNKITANEGNRARNGKDGVVNGEHDWFMNDITTQTREVGIESWTGKSRIAFNRIVNPDGNGGCSGITLGHEGHQKALFNYVSGFSYGIEAGISKRDILIDGNTIENCGIGICISSAGFEKTINITNNYISLKENGIGISLSGAECVTISNCIIEYISDNDYTNPSSRSGIGIEVITNMKQVNIENCIFINVSIPFKGSCENYHVSNCKVFNCHEIFQANSYNAIFSKCYFENFNVFKHYAVQGKFLKVENSTFKIASDHSNSGGYVFNGRGNNTTSLLISENNTFENCLENPMVKNATAGGVDIRPLIFKTNGVYYTFNQKSFSDIKSLAPACGIELMGGDYFIDNYYSLEFRAFKNGNHHMINSPSIPTTGYFVKGDRVYNSMENDVTCDGWICTVSGDFSNERPTFKKFGLLES